MKNKILSVLLTVIMLSCFFSIYISNGATLEEQKQEAQNKKEETEQKLEYVQDELSAAVVKIQELDDTIKQAQSELDSMTIQLEEMQKKVEDITKKLEEVEKSYKENHAMMEERMTVMYEYGDISYLDILLNSSNIIDFLSSYYMIEEIMKSDTELLDTIERERNEVEKAKNELEQEKANLKTLQVKKQQKYVILQNNKIIQQNAINQLSEDEKGLQAKVEEYKAEEARIENLIKLASNDYVYNGEYTGGVMAWPIAKSGTYITSPYGNREHPIQGVVKKHTGIDIGNAGFGAPIIAAADGIVSLAGYNGGYGNCVMINHGNGISTLYGHGQKILTTVGTQVKKGDLIMEVGSTGMSTGPHLHFEVRVNGSIVDPMPYLQ